MKKDDTVLSLLGLIMLITIVMGGKVIEIFIPINPDSMEVLRKVSGGK